MKHEIVTYKEVYFMLHDSLVVTVCLIIYMIKHIRLC